MSSVALRCWLDPGQVNNIWQASKLLGNKGQRASGLAQLKDLLHADKKRAATVCRQQGKLLAACCINTEVDSISIKDRDTLLKLLDSAIKFFLNITDSIKPIENAYKNIALGFQDFISPYIGEDTAKNIYEEVMPRLENFAVNVLQRSRSIAAKSRPVSEESKAACELRLKDSRRLAIKDELTEIYTALGLSSNEPAAI